MYDASVREGKEWRGQWDLFRGSQLYHRSTLFTRALDLDVAGRENHTVHLCIQRFAHESSPSDNA